MSSENGGEDIVDRISGALSTLRRERDELHRKKELAIERLKMVKEERISVEKVVQSMQHELEQLTSEADRKVQDEMLVQIEKEVERLRSEANFQHQELIAKKEILSQIESRITHDQMNRANQLQRRLSELRGKRGKTAEHMKQEVYFPGNEPQLIELFLRELNDHRHNESFIFSLSRLIDLKASEVETESSVVSERCESLKKRIHSSEELPTEAEMMAQ